MLIINEINNPKKSLFIEDYKNTLEEVFIRKSNVDSFFKNWTDGDIIYFRKMFLLGEEEGVRTAIDDYCLISDKLAFVYIPRMRKTMPEELKQEFLKISKKWDSWRNENMGAKELEELKTFFKKVKREWVVDFDYLKEAGIEYITAKDAKWELAKIDVDAVTGMDVYTIRAVTDKVKYGQILDFSKLPKKLYFKLKPYIGFYNGPSDELDPLYSNIERGTIYTFQKESVEKVLKEWEEQK